MCWHCLSHCGLQLRGPALTDGAHTGAVFTLLQERPLQLTALAGKQHDLKKKVLFGQQQTLSLQTAVPGTCPER